LPNGTEKFSYLKAYFGEDADNDGYYSSVWVYGDYYQPVSDGKGGDRGQAAIYRDVHLPTANSINYMGVALVSTVPIPAAAYLFGSALLGLGMVKRKKA
jgi:hypothetical protein